jgi:hypothetical protein
MSAEETLHDVNIREQQLESFILRSMEYRRRVDQALRRQVAMLFLAIALLVVFHNYFPLLTGGGISILGASLLSLTALLAIGTCVLLIRTKGWLQRLNEKWLTPQEKIAVASLRVQREQIETRLAKAPTGDMALAGLN